MQTEEQIVQSTEQNILHLERWNHTLLRLIWLLFGILDGVALNVVPGIRLRNTAKQCPLMNSPNGFLITGSGRIHAK